MFRTGACGKLSSTTDGWTSGNDKAVLAVSATWFTESFELKHAVLGFREVGTSHTGENIGTAFVEVLQEYGVEEKVRNSFSTYRWTCLVFLSFVLQLHCVTTDDVSANSTFMEVLMEMAENGYLPFSEKMWIPCFEHIINDAVQEALSHMEPLLQKVFIFLLHKRNSINLKCSIAIASCLSQCRWDIAREESQFPNAGERQN